MTKVACALTEPGNTNSVSRRQHSNVRLKRLSSRSPPMMSQITCKVSRLHTVRPSIDAQTNVLQMRQVLRRHICCRHPFIRVVKFEEQAGFSLASLHQSCKPIVASRAILGHLRNKARCVSGWQLHCSNWRIHS